MHIDLGHGYAEVQGVKCFMPEMPPKYQIQNYGVPKKDQKWKKTELPTFNVRDIDIWDGSEFDSDDEIPWEEAVRQEQIKITGCDPTDLDRSGDPKPVAGVEPDADYVMESLEAFRSQELNKIHNGHWVYINGKAYYLPGPYYFYLNYWWCGDCFPEFRYPDLELAWLWEMVRKSPTWLGLIYITIRSTGKSYFSAAINYHVAITRKEARTGIQSKTDDDAADYFRDKILIPAGKLPEFLRGINTAMYLGDNTKDSNIDFSPPSRRKIPMKVYNKMRKNALRSKMDYGNAGEKTYDGQSLSFYLGDEIGKTQPSVADVYERWQVVFNCVWRGNKKRGTAFLTSTVSKLAEGGAECKKIWDNSDVGKINDNGRTATGLVRYFRPDIEATYFDEFGFPDIEKSKSYHDAERKSRDHDPQALVTYKQQNPRNSEEAFWITSAKCVYNAGILLAAKDRIMNSDRKVTRRGDIIWKIKDEIAEWVDNEVNGKWFVSFFDFTQNMTQINNGHKKSFTPKANHKRVMAFDPYSTADIVDEDRGSNAAAAVYNKYDMNISEDYCDTIIADYLYRHPDPFNSYEDIICGAFFFGCGVLVEKNKSNAIDYFRQRGYAWGNHSNPDDFILERPESTLTKYGDKVTDGITSGPGTIEHYTNSTARHIQDHGHKLKHLRVIDDWLLFNPAKTKKYDMAVAASYSIVAAEKKLADPGNTINLDQIYKTYDNRGSYSVRR